MNCYRDVDDVHANHIGIFVERIVSLVVPNVSDFNLVVNGGEKLKAWVDYDSSSVPNFHPYYGSMMRNPSQTLPFNGYMPMVNENVPSGGAPEFPEFSTQITIANEDSTPKSKKNQQPSWNTEQNLVLISGWIKFGTSSVVGRNQKGETYWGQIADYCNEHCSFDPPRDGVACRNRFNYMNKIVGKWIDAYDGAKHFQGSGWSENDVLAKAQEIYACGKNVRFTLMEE
ncbi:unnamed protein product [Trifolium pratense]|uniref:Uncharacterized protein n=1 Tax=Trifolium pratense TaxID=57577 RepID=A0ACB0JLU5_TRIPR|nr:unnamed protein product [Trifolium pratense]